MTAIDRDQALAALNGLKKSIEPSGAARNCRACGRDPIVLDSRKRHNFAIEDAIEALAALPAIPLDDDTELSDIMEYLCEHFDASMDEHEVSRMSAMIREYASNVAKSRGALPVLETPPPEEK